MLWVEPDTTYQTHVVTVLGSRQVCQEAYWGSDSIPDLLAIAEVWPFDCEIVTYETIDKGTPDERDEIREEYDKPLWLCYGPLT
jgi:hypothetical protein